MTEVTRLLEAIDRGDTAATDELLPIVYNELRRIASSKLAKETPGQTLQTTALVHEAYMRLLGGGASDAAEDGETGRDWQSRGHFFAAASEAMRRILIDSARRKKRLKRGGASARVGLDSIELAMPAPSVDLIALDDALVRLEEQDELKASVVKLRYFAGLTIEQTAAALSISEPTVKRHWYYARAWLRREMEA